MSNLQQRIDLDEARLIVEPGAREGVPIPMLALGLVEECAQLRRELAAKAEALVAAGWLPPDQVQAFSEAEVARGSRLGTRQALDQVSKAGWQTPENVRKLLTQIVATIEGMEEDDRPEVMAARHACASIVATHAARLAGG